MLKIIRFEPIISSLVAGDSRDSVAVYGAVDIATVSIVIVKLCCDSSSGQQITLFATWHGSDFAQHLLSMLCGSIVSACYSNVNLLCINMTLSRQLTCLTLAS